MSSPPPSGPGEPRRPRGGALRFLYRDAALVVVDKPSGLLSHRTELAPDRDAAMIRARDALGERVYPVHRLDRGTSGALVLARSPQVASAVQALFVAGLVEKIYLGLARGHVPAHALVDHPVPRAEGAEARVEAVTEVWRVAEGPHCSLFVASPRTGRYHQIRRHLAHLRHPLALDSTYGTGWFNRDLRARVGLGRLALHAARIALPHPRAPRGRIEVFAPAPEDLRGPLRALGLGEALDALEASLARGEPAGQYSSKNASSAPRSASDSASRENGGIEPE